MNKIFESYWGIDVSKNWLDIALDNQVFRINQDENAIEEFLNQHSVNECNTLVTLESTGGYEQLAVEHFSKRGFRVHVAHPMKVKSFARAKGRLAKTDIIDARLLRDYGRFVEFSEIRDLPCKIARELGVLGSRLGQLKEMHHQESCRLGVASEQFTRRSIGILLNVIKTEIKEIEKEMLEKINSAEELKSRYQLLQTMKGVGPTLALSLVSSVPELGMTNKKEIAALIGVAPITNQSGQRNGRAATRYGRNGVRKILYMGALAACRHNNKFKHFYMKLIQAGKPKKVAIVAVMRKMIVILNAMIMSKRAYMVDI